MANEADGRRKKRMDGERWRMVAKEGKFRRTITKDGESKKGANIRKFSPVATNVRQKHLTKDWVSSNHFFFFLKRDYYLFLLIL